jgi:LysR family transcriptional regulator of gallate degradation
MPSDCPSLRQLRAFEAVARLQSISSAAAEINLSQPGLTQTIDRLEAHLKTLLLERRRSGSYVTELGRIFLPRVRRFFEHIRLALCEPIVGTPFADRQSSRPLENKITGAQVRSLIAISESGSFDRAARHLGVSQPSLHRSARDLERVLRRTLYQRTARGFTTTPQGAELARRFKVALREIEYGIEELRAAHGVVISRITLGNIPHSQTHLLSAAINEFSALYPDACVQVLDGHYDALLDDLRAGKLDILFGVLRRPPWAIDVEEELLFRNPYAVVARRDHPLALRKTITLRDLAGYQWIMPGSGTPRRQAFERIFAGRTELPKVSIETTSMEIYKTVLATSDRITLMSELEARLDDNFGLRVLPFRSPVLSRSDGIATRAGWKPPGIHRRFLELLRAHARVLVQGAAALIIAASLTLGPPANAQTKDFAFLLPGSAACAKLLPLEKLHGKGRDRATFGQLQAYEEVKGWLQGYFTAANIFDGRGDGDFTKALKPRDLMTWMFGYCRSNPTKGLMDGVAELHRSLREKVEQLVR